MVLPHSLRRHVGGTAGVKKPLSRALLGFGAALFVLDSLRRRVPTLLFCEPRHSIPSGYELAACDVRIPLARGTAQRRHFLRGHSLFDLVPQRRTLCAVFARLALLCLLHFVVPVNLHGTTTLNHIRSQPHSVQRNPEGRAGRGPLFLHRRRRYLLHLQAAGRRRRRLDGDAEHNSRQQWPIQRNPGEYHSRRVAG